MYEEQLRQKRIFLPNPPKPLGTYLPAVRSGNILFVSGMLPIINGKISTKGKVGRELNQQEGYEAARLCVINGLAVVKAELGSLERVKKVLKVVGYVASEEAFVDQPKVVDGASDLLVDIFGNNGKHARVTIGVAELPGNIPVEIELIFEIKSEEKKDDEPDNDIASDYPLNRIEQKKKTKNKFGRLNKIINKRMRQTISTYDNFQLGAIIAIFIKKNNKIRGYE